MKSPKPDTNNIDRYTDWHGEKAFTTTLGFDKNYGSNSLERDAVAGSSPGRRLRVGFSYVFLCTPVHQGKNLPLRYERHRRRRAEKRLMISWSFTFGFEECVCKKDEKKFDCWTGSYMKPSWT
jgi:hypothetical protein